MTEEKATFAGGCFWCVEAAFKELDGVESVVSGYCGGSTDNPSYEEICSGKTGHAEAVQIEYNPSRISYSELLEVFFSIHNPTTMNRQGPDIGSQYRSAIFYHDDSQRREAEKYIKELEESGIYDGIVTEIEPLKSFYRAEEYHQDYFEKNPEQAYCRVNVKPKIDKVREEFTDLIKG